MPKWQNDEEAPGHEVIPSLDHSVIRHSFVIRH
jgi:hypothetical protein